jgi:uncharacterized membrane protein YkvA (DUF1232 family)
MSAWAWAGVGAGAAVASYAAFVLALVLAGKREDARALAGFVPDCAVLLARLARDPRVPRRTKVLLAALAAYLAMPLDLVPDVVPVAGQLDDAILVALVLRAVVRAAGPQVVAERWPGPAVSLRLLLRAAGVSAGSGPARRRRRAPRRSRGPRSAP